MDATEPLLKESIKAGVGSVIVLLVALGVPISDQLQTAIIGVIPFVALLYALYFGRKKVVPVDRANQAIEAVTKQDATFNQATINKLKF